VSFFNLLTSIPEHCAARLGIEWLFKAVFLILGVVVGCGRFMCLETNLNWRVDWWINMTELGL